MRVLISFHTHVQVSVIKDLGGVVHVIIVGGKCCCATLPENAIARLKAHALVEFVEPDVQLKVPTHSSHGRDCGHHDGPGEPPPEPVTTGIDRIDAELSSARSGDGSGSSDCDVAVLDTGIDLTHPDLNVVHNVSYVQGAATGNDDFGHGSHIAGTIAARDDGLGVVGVAPGARLWAVKVADRLGNAYASTVMNGLAYVVQHADEIDVAVLCIGYQGNDPLLSQALSGCVAAGVPLAVAAGNGSKDAANFIPANHPDVIAVSAIVDTDGRAGGLGAGTIDGADDTFAGFSNFGSCIDLAAPGGDITSTWMNGEYKTISGTSAAAPFVAGAAALYRSAHPGATPAEVRQALIDGGFPQAGPSGFSGDTDGIPEPVVNAGGL